MKEAAPTPLAVIPEDEAAVEQASETPLADIFINKVSMSIDEESNDNDKTLLQWTAELLWQGNYEDKASGKNVPYANVARLEKLLSETARVRHKYHRKLFSANILADLDSERDLTTWEAQEIHNAWMNDVDDWMDSECLQKYTDLIKEANAAKGSAGKPAKGSAGKPVKGSAGKLAKGNGGKTAKGDAGKDDKPAQGPRQRAQQIKKQRFNKIISDIACKKAFFMSFVRFPASLETDKSIKNLLLNIQSHMCGEQYKKMVEVSKKKTPELAKLKYDRDQARKHLRTGRSDVLNGVDSELARAFQAGTLRAEVTQLEQQFGYRKQMGLTHLLSSA